MREGPRESFGDLNQEIWQILLLSLVTEISSYNLRYLLHLIDAFTINTADLEMVGVAIRAIQEKVFSPLLSFY